MLTLTSLVGASRFQNGAEVLAEIPEDGIISYDNVRLRPSVALDLKRQQDGETAAAASLSASGLEHES
jgi:hypothetical protein